MNGSLQYSALPRLLTLNLQVHELENQMLSEMVPAGTPGTDQSRIMTAGCRIAEIQEEIDRTARASLATCWLGNSDADDEEYEL
ncbi:MAG: hypothetical protein O3A93_07745 [Chloroflexi bacterium]|nr:hypothetical protein [Chloroflexota bacterium]MDA1271138.1 hypothetical protein [Chloroflexota bacterium]PKB58711.1 MAG: hypothetical protein BZY83_05590 [SAR202 cluster bacterium Casp-Chloro-G2]